MTILILRLEAVSRSIPYYQFGLVDNANVWPIKKVIVGPTAYKNLAMDSLCQILGRKGLTYEVGHSAIPYRNW